MDVSAGLMELQETSIDDGTGIEIEDTTSEERITTPFDPTLIRVSTKYMTISLLLDRIEQKALVLTPDFQRKVVWKEVAQSKLIESILIRIPLPAFYVDATDEDKWLVVDGLQRLTSLKRFVLEKTLKLSELEFLGQYNDMTYDKLPPIFQRRIKETQVTVYLIEPGTPSEVKFNIFRRINTGGLPLSSQEIRHALNSEGPVNNYLARLADSKEFKKATDNSIRDTRMGDREMVLRFLAFTITSYTEYRTTDLDAFLNDKMAELSKMPEEKRTKLENRFLRAMSAAYDIFGDDAFRKRYSASARRSFVNKALFEAWSVNLDRVDDEQIRLLKRRQDPLKKKFITLMNQRDFDNAVSQGTGGISKVRLRFKAIEELIAEVLK